MEVLNCMHRFQRLPVFKPDNLVNLLACGNLLHVMKSREEKKKGYHIVAEDSGTKHSIDIIINFLPCARSEIIRGWVHC